MGRTVLQHAKHFEFCAHLERAKIIRSAKCPYLSKNTVKRMENTLKTSSYGPPALGIDRALTKKIIGIEGRDRAHRVIVVSQLLNLDGLSLLAHNLLNLEI